MSTPRPKIIAGNWKMNKTASEARTLVGDLQRELSGVGDGTIVLCPPFTALSVIAGQLGSGSNLQLGAQNLHEAVSGAFTGEISGAMLRDLGVTYVIIGHSERRQYFREDDALINRKIKTALTAGLRPIVCVGETLPQRESGQWMEVLATQVRDGLAGLSAAELAKIVLAYEPVWAIGTGQTATGAQAQEAHHYLRGQIEMQVGSEAAAALQIQYGGSVKPDNAHDLLTQPDIDGALVGGASLEAKVFAALIKNSLSP